MSIINESTQKTIRRPASKTLEVYDIHKKAILGHIIDLSQSGMKLLSVSPTRVHHTYFCKIILEKQINGVKEISVDADCRWCRKNDEMGMYNSGYTLTFPTQKDARLVEEILRGWMADHLSTLNNRYKIERRKERRFLPSIFGKKNK